MGSAQEFLVFLVAATARVICSALALGLSPLLFALSVLRRGKRKTFKSILITGASQGIGASMAEYWAAPGVTLHLVSRSEDKLKEVAKACTTKGATVNVIVADVVDAEATEAAIHEADRKTPLDAVIANAGVADTTLPAEWSRSRKSRVTLEVNAIGVSNTIFPAYDCMKERRAGQIAIVSSVASAQPLPFLGTYAASKAAARCIGESFRPIWAKKKIGLSVLCPGFVRSAMTESKDGKKESLPFMMEQPEATELLCGAVERNVAVQAFPTILAGLSFGIGEAGFEFREFLYRFLA